MDTETGMVFSQQADHLSVSCFRGAYWYASAYVGLFVLIPLLNAGIKVLSRNSMRVMLLAFMMFSIAPTLFGVDAFGVNGGYSTLWLVFLYVIGAYMKKYGIGKNRSSSRAFWRYAACVLLSWGFKMVCEYITAREVVSLVAYTSPTMVCASVFLLMCFGNMTVSGKMRKLIGAFSPAAFGVYLIHEHEYVRGSVISGNFAFWTGYSVPVMAAGVLATAACIFCVCILIDSVRVMVFRKLQIKEKLQQLEQKKFGCDE